MNNKLDAHTLEKLNLFANSLEVIAEGIKTITVNAQFISELEKLAKEKSQ